MNAMQEQSNQIDLTSIIPQLEALTVPRRYWMVRTMGGTYYGDFIRNNYIAIGFDEVSLSTLERLPANYNQAKEALKIIFADKYEDMNQHGYYSSQLLHFYREIKENDVVIIPSNGASHVAIGIVQGGMYEEENPVFDSEHVCTFKKRRRVAWKVFCRRGNLPPMLQLVFNSRHPVSNVDSYAPYVDSLLNDCYYKDDKLHLVLRIKTRRDVTMNDFFCLNQIKLWAEDFCSKAGYPIDDPIVIKIQMESPGNVNLSTKCIIGALTIGILIVLISGGGFEYSLPNGQRIDMHTDGLLKAISDYKDRSMDRELVNSVKNSLDSLNIDTAKDIGPYLELMRIRNEGRTE